MSTTRRLWIGLATLLIASFGIMLWLGADLHQTAPPVPRQVVTQSGQVVYTEDDIKKGRQVWQRMGGMQLGSIWGHGALIAPDWSADWLHREAEALLEMTAQAEGLGSYAGLDVGQQARLQALIKPQMRSNTYDPVTGTITVSDMRAAAIKTVSAHYESVFSADPATADLRETYAMKNNTVPDAEHRRLMGAFFWWTAWAATTDRPGKSNQTYTK